MILKDNNSEIKLLLGCAKPRIDYESADRICHLLQEKMDWDWIINVASRHGILPLLYRNLKIVCPEAVPKDILANMQKMYLITSRRNLVLTRELLRIIGDFHKHGIEAVPIKGPVLAQMAYGDIALRQFSDLDIMVHRQDVLKAKNLLISQGYQPQIKLTPTQEKFLLQTACEYNFVCDDPAVPIEIHWMFHPSWNSVHFDEGIWSRLKTIAFEGTTVDSFSPEDLILALCSHATRHIWAQMKLVSDLAGMIERNQIAWVRVMNSANDLGLMRMLHIGLFLAHNLLDAGFPKQMFDEIEGDAAARKLALCRFERLFADSDQQEGIFEEYLFWLRTRERLTDKARYLFYLGMKPTMEDYDLIPLPDPLYPLYRIIRPARLFYQYGLKRMRI